MKKTLFLLLTLVLLAGCESKRTCPLCMGAGTVEIFGEDLTCSLCDGEKEVNEDDYERFMETSGSVLESLRDLPSRDDATEPCPFCGGQGSSYGSTCGYCGGSGRVAPDAAARGGHVVGGGSVRDFGGGSSDDASSSSDDRASSGPRDRLCPTCGGSSRCPVCNGAGESTSYGGTPRVCQFCYGQGECPKCMGHGTIPDGV